MKVKIWQFDKFDGDVEVPYGASVAEAIDAANLRFRNTTPIVNGLDAHLGMTLNPGDTIHVVPKIIVFREPQTQPMPRAATEEELDNLFLRGAINITEYCRRLGVLETERSHISLAGATLVFNKAA